MKIDELLLPLPRIIIPGQREGARLPNAPGKSSREISDILTGQERKQLLGDIPLNFTQLGKLTLGRVNPEEGYVLSVDRDGITVASQTGSGTFYAMQTLGQLIAGSGGGEIPSLTVLDEPALPIRGIHLCYHMIDENLPMMGPNFETAMELLKTWSHFKLNTVLIEFDAVFPYRKHRRISNKLAFSENQIREIRSLCEKRHLRIIPLIQSIGHAYSSLRHAEYAHLREVPGTSQQYCISNPAVEDFYLELADEMLKAFPDTEYLHIGGDEARMLGRCRECGEKLAAEGMKGLYTPYVNRIAAKLKSRGVIPIIWSDIIDHYPDILDDLDPEIMIADWHYDIVNDTGRPVRMGEYIENGRKVLGCSAAKFGRQSDYLFFYRKSMRNIAMVNGECVRNGAQGAVVTDWMKIAPTEVSVPAAAYGAETAWSGPRHQEAFTAAFTRIFFGAAGPELDRQLKLLSGNAEFPHEETEQRESLPYNEPNEALVDLRDRFDLYLHNFRRRLGEYVDQTRSEEIRKQCEVNGRAMDPVISKMAQYRERVQFNRRYYDIFLLAAETRKLKCRIGAALQEAISLLKFPRPRDTGRKEELAGTLEELTGEWNRIKKRTGEILSPGTFPQIVPRVLDVKFDPEEREYMEQIIRIIRKGKQLKSSVEPDTYGGTNEQK